MESVQNFRKEFVGVLTSRRNAQCELSARAGRLTKRVDLLPYIELPVARLSSEEAETLVEDPVVLTTEEGEQGQVPISILKRRSGNLKRNPAVLILHNSNKSKDHLRPLQEHYAFHGYLAITVDARYHGDRASSKDSYQNALVSAWKSGKEMPFIFDTVWDVLRILDYLTEREDVDPQRIGVMGLSLGGNQIALFFSCFPLKLNTNCSVIPIGVQNFSWAVENDKWHARVASIPLVFEVAAKDLGKNCVDAETVAAVWRRLTPGLMDRFDVQHCLAAIVPRPLLILNGGEDPRCMVAGLECHISTATQLYRNKGYPENFQFVAEAGVEHCTTASMLTAAKEWFDRFL